MIKEADKLSIDSALIAMTFSNFKVGFAATFVNVVFLSFVMWELVPSDLILLWAGINLLILVLRLVFVYAFNSLKPKGASIYKWKWLYVAGLSISGLALGSAVFFILPESSFMHQMLILVVAGGMIAGSASIFSSVLEAYFLYSISVAIPILIRFIYLGDFLQLEVGFLFTFYWLVISVGAVKMHSHVRDVTSLNILKNTLIEELKEKTMEAEVSAKAKSDFLATVSHEMRTPLTTIKGVRELLEQTSLDKKQERYLEMIKDSSSSLLSLVNDMLDRSIIDEGKLVLNDSSVDLSKVIREISNIVYVKVQSKGLNISFELDPALPQYILSDEPRLKQVLLNIVGNAVKFTDRGNISVKVLKKEDNISFSISDTGIGILDVEAESIFDRFTRGEQSGAGSYGGAGLGLSITKDIVEAMGGRIWVEDNEGRGSVFTFEVPLRSTEKGRENSLQAEFKKFTAKHKIRILVAEDDEYIRHILSAILKRVRTDIEVAENGLVALDKFKKNKFDIVIMDMGMPQMDGYTAASQIREYEDRESMTPVPIIALTAHTMKEQVDKCIASGCTVHLSKPIDQNMLLRTMATLLGI